MQVSAFNKPLTGFSLLEVLVAVLILSFITGTIWVSFSRSVDIQSDTRKVDERTHEARAALERIARDISMAYLSTHRSPDKRTRTVFHGRNSGNADRLDFASFSHLRMMASAREGDECEITYMLDKNGTDMAIYRRESPVIDDDPETGGTRAVLLENATSLDFRYYDPNRGAWTEEWDSEAVAYFQRLPTEVEIKIGYLDYRNNPTFLQTRTLIYMIEALQ